MSPYDGWTDIDYLYSLNSINSTNPINTILYTIYDIYAKIYTNGG